MGPQEKIQRSAMMVVETVKDTLVAAVADAVHKGQLKIEPAELKKLLVLIPGTADAAFGLASSAFRREVAGALADDQASKPIKKKQSGG